MHCTVFASLRHFAAVAVQNRPCGLLSNASGWSRATSGTRKTAGRVGPRAGRVLQVNFWKYVGSCCMWVVSPRQFLSAVRPRQRCHFVRTARFAIVIHCLDILHCYRPADLRLCQVLVSLPSVLLLGSRQWRRMQKRSMSIFLFIHKISAKITTLSFIVSVLPSVHWSVPVELRHSYRTDVCEIAYCDSRHCYCVCV